MFPVGEATIHPTTVVLRAGSPIAAAALLAAADGERRLAIDAIGLAIARLLPPPYAGVYGDTKGSERASEVLHRVSRVIG